MHVDSHAPKGGSYGGKKAPSGKGAQFEKSLTDGHQATGEKAEPTSGDASSGTKTSAGVGTEQQAEQQTFKTFASGVDPETQRRLSTWLPEALGSDKKALKETVAGLSNEQRSDLRALSKHQGGDPSLFAPLESKDTKGGWASPKRVDAQAGNDVKGLIDLQQRYGEHALKEATPGLAPTTSYDTGTMPKAADSAVYTTFTKGLDEATKQQLSTWLPAALDDPSKAPKDPNDPQSEALAKLAKLHGLEKNDARLKSVMTAYHRDKALATAGELPSVFDMMLVQHDGRVLKPATKR